MLNQTNVGANANKYNILARSMLRLWITSADLDVSGSTVFKYFILLTILTTVFYTLVGDEWEKTDSSRRRYGC